MEIKYQILPIFGLKKIIETANTVPKNYINLVSRDTKNLAKRSIFLLKIMKIWPKMWKTMIVGLMLLIVRNM